MKKMALMIIDQHADREGEISYDIAYLWTLKRNNTNELIYKRETDSQAWRTSFWLPGERLGGRDSQGIWD